MFVSAEVTLHGFCPKLRVRRILGGSGGGKPLTLSVFWNQKHCTFIFIKNVE